MALGLTCKQQNVFELCIAYFKKGWSKGERGLILLPTDVMWREESGRRKGKR